jgi:hypothetical protein
MSSAYGQAESSPTAGWYPDPHVAGAHRWWDGTQWTEHTHQEPAPAAPAYADGYQTHAAATGHPQAAATFQPQAAALFQPQTAAAVDAYPSTAVSGVPGFPTASGAAVAYPSGGGGVPGYPEVAGSLPGYPSHAGSTSVYPAAATTAYPSAYPAAATTAYPSGYSAPGYQASAYPAPGYQASGYPAAGYGAPAWSGSAVPFEAPKNGMATGALVAGIVVILVLVFTDYAVASWLAIFVGIKAVKKARDIQAQGYPKAVGMARAVTGLVLSGIGVLLFVLTFFA